MVQTRADYLFGAVPGAAAERAWTGPKEMACRRSRQGLTISLAPSGGPQRGGEHGRDPAARQPSAERPGHPTARPDLRTVSGPLAAAVAFSIGIAAARAILTVRAADSCSSILNRDCSCKGVRAILTVSGPPYSYSSVLNRDCSCNGHPHREGLLQLQ